MEKQVINLYECRFLKARLGQKDFPVGEERITCAGLDITHKRGWVAYYDWTKREYCMLECDLPWETWKMETLHDGQLLEDCLKGLVYYFADQKLGTLDTLGLVVPHSFSAFQRSMIMKIAKNAGIKMVGLEPAGLYSCMAMHFLKEAQSEEVFDLVCDFREDSFELSAITLMDGVYESLGTVGMTCEGGWSSLSANSFEKSIFGEVNQFFRELGFEKTPEGRLKCDYKIRFFMCGQHNDYIVSLIEGLLGITPEKSHGIPAFGGLIQGLLWQGTYHTRDVVKLSTWNRNLWAGLGDDGEKGIVIKRYTTIPMRKSVALLLSRETKLRIYEGNYFNPAYDQLLLEAELEGLDAEEGREIEVTIDIDAHGKIQLSVANHRKECIVDHYEL